MYITPTIIFTKDITGKDRVLLSLLWAYQLFTGLFYLYLIFFKRNGNDYSIGIKVEKYFLLTGLCSMLLSTVFLFLRPADTGSSIAYDWIFTSFFIYAPAIITNKMYSQIEKNHKQRQDQEI